MPIQQLKDNLEYLRIKYCITFKSFSLLIGYSERMYEAIRFRKIEPSLKAMQNVSMIFKVSIDDLVRKNISRMSKKHLESNYNKS